jgi:murein DD-endopeptidase MepM/ murein hydrolase activator NlpD
MNLIRKYNKDKNNSIVLLALLLLFIFSIPFHSLANNNEFISYKVTKGDSLWSISQKYNLSLDLILSYNSIKEKDILSLGQIIKIPQDNLPATDYNMHIVKKGETLWSIAQKYNLSVDLILATNNLTNSELISIGQEMKIPSHKNAVAETNIVSQAVIDQKNNNLNNNISQLENAEPIWSIAEKYKLTNSSIALDNNIGNSELISIGQQIEILSTKNTTPETNIITQAVIDKKNNNLNNNISQPENAEPIVHTVKSGDNLWNISLKYGVSVEAIIEVNNLRDKNLLSLSQELEIPAIGGGVSNSNQKQEPIIVTYTVVKGDTLWSISRRYDLNMSTIISTNNLKEISQLSVGQKLKLPITNMDIAKAEGYDQDTAAAETNIVSQAVIDQKNNNLNNNISQLENAEPIVYSVKAGDNLWNISLKYGVSVEAIIEVNNLRDKDLLSLSQKLEIPAIGGGVSNSNQKQEPIIVTYTVVKGDTLWSISQRYDVKMSSIISTNNLKEISRLSIGQEFKIPITNMDIAKAEGYNQEAAAEEIIYYVEKGESLWSISHDYNVKLESIIAANSITDASKISAGKRLIIPNVPLARRNSNIYNFILPLRGRITSPYGIRVLSGSKEFHSGIDISSPFGSNIVAAENGRVSYAGYMRGYGNVIILSHDEGYSTVYAHNSVNLVKKGQYVKKGSVIAKTGRTGNATGPHLHFEIRLSGKPLNPLLYFK